MREKYLLDANAFIEAKNRYYAFDICPGFWHALEHHSNETRQICSIDPIREELNAIDDDLKDWIASLPASFFKKTEDEGVQMTYGQIVNWVYNNKQFSDAAKSDFAGGADGWLIAFAQANGCTVVTHEQFARDAKKRVMIPNVCLQFSVKYLNTFDMLRALEARFIRQTKR